MIEQLFKNKDSTQFNVRVALMRHKAQGYLSFNDLSELMGISAGTLIRFLAKEIDVRSMTLIKIMTYLTSTAKDEA